MAGTHDIMNSNGTAPRGDTFRRLGVRLGPRGLAWAHGVIAALMLSFAAVLLFVTYRAEALRVDAAAERLHDTVASHFAGSLRASSMTLGLLGRLETAYAERHRRLSDKLATEALEMKELRTLLLLDAAGRVVGDSRPGAPATGIDVSDREYFAAHLRTSESPLYIGEPVRSRIDGEWSLPVSRALRDAEGRLRGVVVASYSVAGIARTLGRAADDRALAVLLTRSDGTILARWPERDETLGTRLRNSRMIGEVQSGSLAGSFIAPSPVDGTDRRAIYSRLVPFDVVVAVGYAQRAFLSAMLVTTLPWLLAIGLALLTVLGSYIYSRRLYRALLAEKQAAEVADRNKTRILAVTSHELRTPLNAILGFSELMAQDPFGLGLPERYRGYVEDIAGAARGLLVTVNDLLDAGQASQGTLTIAPRRVDLAAVLHDSLRRSAPEAAAAGHVLTAELPPVPVHAHVDPDRLAQMVGNLTSNAVKYAPSGSRISVALATLPGAVEILVGDDGPGIAGATREQLFAPFCRGSDAEVAGAEGAGLGLYIVRKLAELHGGSVDYRDGEPQGAVFVIRLPRLAEDEDAEPAEAPDLASFVPQAGAAAA
jgi:hypothetical protein